MLRIRRLLGLGLMAAVALGGCESQRQNIRPPKAPEEFNAPPDEPRYTGPVQYPAEALEQDPLKRSRGDGKGPGGPGGPGGPIGRPGPGGGGMGAGRMPGT